MLETLDSLIATILLESTFAGVVCAMLLLQSYQRAVRRTMREKGRMSVPHVERQRPSCANKAASLRIDVADAPSVPASHLGRALFARARGARGRAILIYGAAGVLFAAILAIFGDPAYNYPMFEVMIWPTILALSTLSTVRQSRKLVVLVLIGIVLWSRAGHDLWLTFAGWPTVIVLFSANRSLKTLSPVLCAVGAVLAAGPQIGSTMPEVVGVVALCFAVWIIGLLLIWALTVAYDHKRFSEQSFLFGFCWTIFAAPYVHDLTWRTAVIALVSYGLFTTVALRVLRREVRAFRPANLLALRVFGTPSRGRRLFESLGLHWRYIGPIHLIAGTDSATENLDPGEAVRFLTFRFRSLYVAGHRDLERRLGGLDTAPDPDGRYRINDFFCFDDTWKTTFLRLLDQSEAVLIDLGGYDDSHAGVAFELLQILDTRPLDTFVLIADRKTNLEHLRAMLTGLWERVDVSSLNGRLANPVLRILRAPTPAQLAASLCDAAVAAGWRPVAHRGLELAAAH